MGNAPVAEELVGIDELEELYRLDASESEPEDDEEDDEDEEDEEDDEDDEDDEEPEGMPNELSRFTGRVRARNGCVRTRPYVETLDPIYCSL
jgi:hypothetical protein